MKIELEVNGERRSLECPGGRRLLDVLRDDLRLTGTKEGCGEGECGACTVLIDGVPANACLVPVGQVSGQRVTTIEGLAVGAQISDLQAALVEFGATQCGICTPGIAVAAEHLLAVEANPSRERVRECLAGNLCRCTGYQLIVDAIVHVAATRRGQ